MDWVFLKDVRKTFAIKDEDFDLIHTAVDGWANIDYPNHLLFEHNGAYYIADDVNNDYLGFNDVVLSRQLTIPSLVVKLIFDNSQWVRYSQHKDKQWFKKGNVQTLGNYYADLSTNTFKPYNIKGGSDPITTQIDFERLGAEVYKSFSLLGTYVWQGSGSRDDIIVGKRKYKHIVESVDIFATESVEIIETGIDSWSYTYNSVVYTYSGELPLGNFIMASAEGDLNMIYQELVTVTKNILHFDGGAQIVD